MSAYIVNKHNLDNFVAEKAIDLAKVMKLGKEDKASIKQMRAEVGRLFALLKSRQGLVLLVEDFDLLNETYQTVFLKVLEEIEDGSMVLLTMTNANKVLPTIRSRCLEYKGERISTEDAYSALMLQNWKKGVAVMFDLVDKMDEDEIEQVLANLIDKMKSVTEDHISENRLNVVSQLLRLQQEIIKMNVGSKKYLVQARIAQIMVGKN